MADVEGRPFLELLLEHLRAQGVTEVVLACGYKAEVIEAHFGDGARFGLRIRCLREPEPLGTAGALRLALPFVRDRALVLNGDTFVDVDVPALLARHQALGAQATLLAVHRDDASRFGRLQINGDRLLSFEEKRPEREPGLISAGVYVLERAALERVPEGRPSSFERELLPSLLSSDAVVAVQQHAGYFEDIGIPQSLEAFRARVRKQRSEIMQKGVQAVRAELEESISVKSRWSDELCGHVAALAERVARSLREGGKVVFFGNGGSAADAQHLAAELVGRYKKERRPLRALALNTNASALTAIGNDYDYATTFERQVDAWVDARDVVVGISTSGNSPNVLRALARAKERGAFAVALTGEGGGKCAGVCDLLLAVPSKSTPRIQESHITLGHILCGMVEELMDEGS
jgi:D-sedoheptulose 7-phosphate isomerase